MQLILRILISKFFLIVKTALLFRNNKRRRKRKPNFQKNSWRQFLNRKLTASEELPAGDGSQLTRGFLVYAVNSSDRHFY